MWWAETAQLYLSRSLVLLHIAGHVQEFALEPDLPLAGALGQLEPMLPKKAALEIHLSSFFCPAIEVRYPDGMHRLRDKIAFARAACAGHLQAGADGLEVDLDPLSPQVVAAIRRPDWEALRAWSMPNRRLRSIRPLWSEATQCLAREKPALILREPDALTLIGYGEGYVVPRAASAPLAADEPIQPLLNRLSQSLSLPAETPLLFFGVRGSWVPQHRPACWTNYWTQG